MDYKLDELLKLKYLHNLFAEESKRYYRNNVQDTSSTFDEAKNKMIGQI